jgi:hypothetical protein
MPFPYRKPSSAHQIWCRQGLRVHISLRRACADRENQDAHGFRITAEVMETQSWGRGTASAALPSMDCPGREIIGTRQSAIAILAASNIAPTWLCLVDYQVLSSRATIHFHLPQMPTNTNESSSPDNN